ncbi:hypothetical protein ACNKHO_26195 [Shigella flexneri]
MIIPRWSRAAHLWCIVVWLYPTLLMVLVWRTLVPSRAGSKYRSHCARRLDDALSHLLYRRQRLREVRSEREVLALQRLSAFWIADDTDCKRSA